MLWGQNNELLGIITRKSLRFLDFFFFIIQNRVEILSVDSLTFCRCAAVGNVISSSQDFSKVSEVLRMYRILLLFLLIFGRSAAMDGSGVNGFSGGRLEQRGAL